MSEWFAENGGTLIVCALLAVLVGGIVCKMIRDKKKGKSACGCNCACCPMSGACHKKT